MFRICDANNKKYKQDPQTRDLECQSPGHKEKLSQHSEGFFFLYQNKRGTNTKPEDTDNSLLQFWELPSVFAPPHFQELWLQV